jgi:hypothetical protein
LRLEEVKAVLAIKSDFRSADDAHAD